MISAINHNEPKIVDVIQIEVPGSEHGTGITVHENNIFISGWKEDDKSQGIVAKYSTSPDQSLHLEWSILWPSMARIEIDNKNEFSDISVAGEGIYLVGKGTSFAKDDVGSLEEKSYLVKFSNHKETGIKPEKEIWFQ